MICIPAMKSKIHLEVYESEILKSIASQSKEETFDFVEKILNNYEYPTEIAGELIGKLEEYIDNYQKNEWQRELLEYVDENGNLQGKYKPKRKKPRVDKKIKGNHSDDEKPSYCIK